MSSENGDSDVIQNYEEGNVTRCSHLVKKRNASDVSHVFSKAYATGFQFLNRVVLCVSPGRLP